MGGPYVCDTIPPTPYISTTRREARMEHVLASWESFYVIVGSSAAALTGLQFVVIALVAETTRRTGARQFSAFATPTVVHFGGVLLTSSVLSAPWPTLHGVSFFLIVAGLC